MTDNNLSIHRYDWREAAKEQMKQAAELGSDDKNNEIAFAELAIQQITNKIPSLMEPKYRIGFEVVKKRGDDNRQMLGIFGIKVGDKVLFALAFFMNGKIEGTDLLYDTSQKRFIASTKEWAAYLIAKSEEVDGKAVGREILKDTAPLVFMERMAFPPQANAGRMKIASEGEKAKTLPEDEISSVTEPGAYKFEEEQLKDLWGAGLTDVRWSNGRVKFASLFAKLADQWAVNILENIPAHEGGKFKTAGVLKELLQDEQYGHDFHQIILKTASEKPEVAELLYKLYPNGSDLFVPKQEKKAAALPVDELALHIPSVIPGEKRASKEARASFMRDGFWIEDVRPLDTINYVTVNDLDKYLQSPNIPGEYEMLMQDGKLQKMLVLKAAQGDETHKVLLADAFHRNGTSNNLLRTLDSSQVYYLDGGKAGKGWTYIRQGKPLRTWNEDMASEHLQDTPPTGKMALAVRKHDGKVVAKVFVKSQKNTNNGIYSYTGAVKPELPKKEVELSSPCNCHCPSCTSCGSLQEVTLCESTGDFVVNTTRDIDYVEGGVFGSNIGFYPLASSRADETYPKLRDFDADNYVDTIWSEAKMVSPLATYENLNDWILDNTGAVPLKLEQDGKEFVIKVAKQKEALKLDKLNAAVLLTRDLGIKAAAAMEMLDKTQREDKPTSWLLTRWPNKSCGYLEAYKTASNRGAPGEVTIIDTPDFKIDYDPELGISKQPYEYFALRSVVQDDMVPAQRVGDALNGETLTGLPNSVLTSSDPAELEALTKVYKVPYVYEHGVIEQLANMTNAKRIIDQVIEPNMKAIDQMGRFLFACYWFVDDLEKYFGQDTLTSMKGDFEELFVNLSNRTLELMKKSDNFEKSVSNSEDE